MVSFAIVTTNHRKSADVIVARKSGKAGWSKGQKSESAGVRPN